MKKKPNLSFVFKYVLIILGILVLLISLPLIVMAQVMPSAFPSGLSIVLTATGLLITLLGSFLSDVLGFFLSFSQARRNQVSPETHYFPFEIFIEPWGVLPAFLPEPGMIRAHKLPYQRRNADLNLTDKIRDNLFRHRKLLITGVSGIGKTREVSKLVSELIDEGFTVLRAEINAHFDKKIFFPDNLRHKLVLVFDDMHLRCSDPSTTLAEEVKPQDMLDGLFSFLTKVENRFGTLDVYVIFVSRSDTHSWEFLNYPGHPIWNDVYDYQLPYPTIDCQKEFVLAVASRLDIPIDDGIAQAIAEANDYTFSNLIQNLYRAKRDHISLSLENFTSRQGLTWDDRYKALDRRFPREIPVLFDVLNILTRMKLPLHPHLVIELTTSLMLNLYGGQIALPIRWIIRRRVLFIVSYLQRNGDLILDTSRNQYTVQEAMLAIQHGDLKVNTIIPIIWQHALSLPEHQFDAWLQTARYAIFEARHFKLGLQILTRLLRINPDHAQTRLTRGQALFLIGWHRASLEDLNIAQRFDPTNPEVLITRGIVQGVLGELKGAKSDFDEAIFLAPNEISAYINRSYVFELQRDYKSALEDISHAIELRSDSPWLYLKRAKLYWAIGDYKSAEEDFRRAHLEHRSEWASIHAERARLYLKQVNKLDIACQEIEKAIELAPHAPEAHLIKSLVFRQKGDLAIAKLSINRAIQLSPFESRYYYLRAEIHSEQNEDLNSLSDLNRALGTNPHEANYLRTRGVILRKLGITDLAYRDFIHSAKHDRNNPLTFLELAGILMRWRSLDRALETINQCLTLDSENAEAYHLRAHIYAQQQRTQMALADFDKAIELDPKNGKHYFSRGEFQRSRRQKSAIKDLAKARKYSPETIWIHFAYIAAYKDFGRLKRVKEIYLHEVLAQPENTILLTSYAYICWLGKDQVLAEEYLQRSAQLPTPNVTVAYHQCWVAIRCKKPLLAWKLLWKNIQSRDETFMLEYLLYLYTYLPVPKLLRQFLYSIVLMQSGIRSRGFGFKWLKILWDRWHYRDRIITKRDIALA